MSLLRVFPRRTNCTPQDSLAVIGGPSLFEPRKDIDEVHISCLFSWDREECSRLYESWGGYYGNVKVGGPAIGLLTDEFVPGRYVRKGIALSTRGCNFDCPWCLVPKREGRFRELKRIPRGNIVQDNNILLASEDHLVKLFLMLEGQKGIIFSGGLDCRLLKDWHIEEMRSLSIKAIWLALDCSERMSAFEKACAKLRQAGFTRDHIRAYVLAGFNEPIQDAEGRLRFVYNCGVLPFIQVYQGPTEHKRMAGKRSREDNLFVHKWSRPAMLRRAMEPETANVGKETRQECLTV